MNNIEQDINNLVRANIRALKPYSSARDEAPESDFEARIMMDANENSFGGPLSEDFSRYPDPQQLTLKKALAQLKCVDAANIFIGNGSDEAIDLLCRAFVEPGRDNIIIMPPTYGMYTVQGNIHGAEIRQAPLRADFLPDHAAVRRLTDQRSKLLFLCSPNNPTGQCLPESFVMETLANFPGLVVVDEAYSDFSDKPSWLSKLKIFPRLVVLQTFSKAWGLAGLRLGMAYANPFIVNNLNKIKYPYNINTTSLRLGLEALSQTEKVAEKTRQILSERMRLQQDLPRLPCVEMVYPSHANFLLIRVKDAEGLYRYLAKEGIIVRNRNKELHCENCLRITVGTSDENDRLLEAMSIYSQKPITIYRSA